MMLQRSQTVEQRAGHGEKRGQRPGAERRFGIRPGGLEVLELPHRQH